MSRRPPAACTSCAARLISRRKWYEHDKPTRARLAADGTQPHAGHGLCPACHQQARKQPTGSPRPARKPRRPRGPGYDARHALTGGHWTFCHRCRIQVYQQPELRRCSRCDSPIRAATKTPPSGTSGTNRGNEKQERVAQVAQIGETKNKPKKRVAQR